MKKKRKTNKLLRLFAAAYIAENINVLTNWIKSMVKSHNLFLLQELCYSYKNEIGIIKCVITQIFFSRNCEKLMILKES